MLFHLLEHLSTRDQCALYSYSAQIEKRDRIIVSYNIAGASRIRIMCARVCGCVDSCIERGLLYTLPPVVESFGNLQCQEKAKD